MHFSLISSEIAKFIKKTLKFIIYRKIQNIPNLLLPTSLIGYYLPTFVCVWSCVVHVSLVPLDRFRKVDCTDLLFFVYRSGLFVCGYVLSTFLLCLRIVFGRLNVPICCLLSTDLVRLCVITCCPCFSCVFGS